MQGDELAAVGERRLDLDVGHHLGDAVHDLVAGQHLAAGASSAPRPGRPRGPARSPRCSAGPPTRASSACTPRASRSRATMPATAISSFSVSEGARFIRGPPRGRRWARACSVGDASERLFPRVAAPGVSAVRTGRRPAPARRRRRRRGRRVGRPAEEPRGEGAADDHAGRQRHHGGPDDEAVGDEDDGRDEVGEAEDHGPQRRDPDQRLGQDEGQRGDDERAGGRAEVAAVDRDQPDGHDGQRVALGQATAVQALQPGPQQQDDGAAATSQGTTAAKVDSGSSDQQRRRRPRPRRAPRSRSARSAPACRSAPAGPSPRRRGRPRSGRRCSSRWRPAARARPRAGPGTRRPRPAPRRSR